MVSTRSGRSVGPTGEAAAAKFTRKTTRRQTEAADTDGQQNDFQEEGANAEPEQLHVEQQTPATATRRTVSRLQSHQQDAPSPAPFQKVSPIKDFLSPRSTKSAVSSPEAKTPAAMKTPQTLRTTQKTQEVMTVSKLPLPQDEEPYSSSDDEPVRQQLPFSQGAPSVSAKRARHNHFGKLLASLLLACLATAGLIALTCWGLASSPHTSQLASASEPFCSSLKESTLHLAARLRDVDFQAVQQAAVVKAQQLAQEASKTLHGSMQAAKHMLSTVLEKKQPSFQQVLPLSSFQSLLCQEGPWVQRAAEFWQDEVSQLLAKPKGAGVLLVCKQSSECSTALEKLQQAVPHAIVLAGRNFSTSESAGHAQQAIGTYLQSTPNGVIIVDSPERMHLHSLSVLNNALSESGNLQLSGQSIPTSRALYVMLFKTALDSGLADYDVKIKELLLHRLEQSAPADQTAIAKAFRRRIDFLAPAGKVEGAAGSSAAPPAPPADAVQAEVPATTGSAAAAVDAVTTDSWAAVDASTTGSVAEVDVPTTDDASS